MGTFELVRVVPADAEATFAVVGDLTAYGQFVVATTLSTDPLPIGEGWCFTARTGIGPLAVVDRMTVTAWDPPHRFAVRKLGPVLDGWADVRVAEGAAGTTVRWREEITVRPRWLGRRLTVVTDPVNRRLFGRALDRMVARVRAA